MYYKLQADEWSCSVAVVGVIKAIREWQWQKQQMLYALMLNKEWE